MAKIIVDSAVLDRMLEAILYSCYELNSMNETDSWTDVLYHGEQIKLHVYTIKEMIEAAKKTRQLSNMNYSLNEIEHEVMMMGFSDDETAADDWSFSGPRIRRAVDELRRIIKQSEPAEPANN